MVVIGNPKEMPQFVTKRKHGAFCRNESIATIRSINAIENVRYNRKPSNNSYIINITIRLLSR